MHSRFADRRRDRVVVTGIGLVTSVGLTRESTWAAVQQGKSGVRRVAGVPCIPDGLVIGAPVDIELDQPGQLKSIRLATSAADEAIDDAGIDLSAIDLDRFGSAITGHMGDTGFVNEQLRLDLPTDPATVPWWQQWMPNTACSAVSNRFGLRGPRICHSTACASSTIEIISAMRAIQDGQCDVAIAGGTEGFHPLFVAGFRAMRVLADHAEPSLAARPFDAQRNGFVMGEGAGMLVLERYDHAAERGARIYAELLSGCMLSQGFHVTDLDAESCSLTRLISETLGRADLAPADVEYINAHGTGTLQNDVAEIRAIRGAFGSHAESTLVSSTKSMLGHLVNASGVVELAITILGLRDGFAPPTINLTEPDPECDLDCIPLFGRSRPLQTALKLSVAFGGHLAAVAVRRWPQLHVGVGDQRRQAA